MSSGRCTYSVQKIDERLSFTSLKAPGDSDLSRTAQEGPDRRQGFFRGSLQWVIVGPELDICGFDELYIYRLWTEREPACFARHVHRIGPVSFRMGGWETLLSGRGLYTRRQSWVCFIVGSLGSCCLPGDAYALNVALLQQWHDLGICISLSLTLSASPGIHTPFGFLVPRLSR